MFKFLEGRPNRNVTLLDTGAIDTVLVSKEGKTTRETVSKEEVRHAFTGSMTPLSEKARARATEVFYGKRKESA